MYWHVLHPRGRTLDVSHHRPAGRVLDPAHQAQPLAPFLCVLGKNTNSNVTVCQRWTLWSQWNRNSPSWNRLLSPWRQVENNTLRTWQVKRATPASSDCDSSDKTCRDGDWVNGTVKVQNTGPGWGQRGWLLSDTAVASLPSWFQQNWSSKAPSAGSSQLQHLLFRLTFSCCYCCNWCWLFISCIDLWLIIFIISFYICLFIKTKHLLEVVDGTLLRDSTVKVFYDE